MLVAACRSYTHYCACGKMLDERLQQMGASRLADRGDIDKEDWPAIEAWIDSVVAALPTLKLQTVEHTGLPSGEPVPAPRTMMIRGTVILPAKHALNLIYSHLVRQLHLALQLWG